MRAVHRAMAPGLLAVALLFFLGGRLLTAEAPPAADDFFASPVMLEFDGARYDVRGLRYRLQAERVTAGEDSRTQIFRNPRFRSLEADGGRWEARAQRAELRGEILQLHGDVQARRLFVDSAPLEMQGERLERREGAPLLLEGSPARFRRRAPQAAPFLHGAPQTTRGHARRLYFDAEDGRLRLEGGAVLERDDGVLRSESLEYFVRAEDR